MRNFRFTECYAELPRTGYIMSKDKLYQVKDGAVVRTYDLPGENIDENISYAMDSSGMFDTIPSCCIPDEATIFVDGFELFKPEENDNSVCCYHKRHNSFIAIIAVAIVAATVGAVIAITCKKK